MPLSSDDGRTRNMPQLAPSHLPFPVVGLGASAGGLPALIKFLEHMPANNGMAFVVILHLSPKHQSAADTVLQRVTRMPVIQVSGSVPIEREHVYVIPPNKHMSMNDGVLVLSDLEKSHGQNVAIDVFFRTLAEVHRERAIAVVLSGSGADGAVGLERIKEQGGVTIAQDPADAEHEGMPSAAIATEMVDFVLPVAEIPQKLIDLWSVARHIHLPDIGDGELSVSAEQVDDARATDEEALQRVITMLCANTGHDFRHYKRATVLRRIERRLQVRGVTSLPEYCTLLEKEQGEFKALLQDMLIGVTNFFRDRESFEALERDVVPLLFKDKLPAEQVRVWVAACASGQEAYSMTMLLADHAAQLAKPAEIQVFASDIDEHAIAVARAGVYPAAISMDVPASRMRQFFTKEEDRYRIRKAVRDRILFASHNLLRDPPFSKLDMISCRNLLIYLNRDVQLRVMEMFHSALKPDGFLFLGSSESADAASEFFVPFDKKNRIYRARPLARSLRYVPALTNGPVNRVPELMVAPNGARRQFSFSDVHQRALGKFAPPSLIVDRDSNIVHMSDAAGRFLRHVGGEPSRNVLALVLPELRLEVRTALYQALQSSSSVEGQRVLIKREDGKSFIVNVIVRPFTDEVANAEFALVLFEEIEQTMNGVPAEAQAQHQDVVLNQLEAELQRSKEKLQETIEHAEVSNEELRASNEELQAINEELRSATEELETSKEELQSVNEELITVNYELKVKVEETGKANDDLNNLIASTDIATIFVDRAMRIKRFTPRAADIFSIIPSDIGRSLLDITHRLDYDMLAEDVSATFDTLRLVEREMRSNDGRHYIVRLLPYRTTEDKIEGAVMTFFDISTRKEAEEKVRASEEWVRRVAANQPGSEGGVPLHTMAEARDEFLTVMSQELRHPLNLIYINAELLARMPAVQQSPPALRSAAIIRNAVANQSRIIDDLHNMSRLHAGKLAMSCHDEDLGAIAQRLVDLLRTGTAAETVDLRYEPPHTPAVVYVDAVRIEQVLLNLLNNAIRFTSAGGIVTLRITLENAEARIDVIDTGEGIAPNVLPHIFDMYSQAHAAELRRKGGLGIGLALVRQLVELHGGRVDASSSGLGEGSTFTVWLPLSRTGAPAVSSELSPLASCVAGRSVLLLDDDDELSGMFKALLELDGASVRVAKSPAEALSLLELERCDLLIADISLPGMQDHSFIRDARAISGMGTVPVIATSTMAREKEVVQSMVAGYSAHITKPLSLDILCGKLAGLLPPLS